MPGTSSHDHCNEMVSVTVCRSDQVITRGANVSGFDSVHPCITHHHMVMGNIRLAFKAERLGFEEREILREVMPESKTEHCHITCRCMLARVGQTVGIVK